MKGNKFENEEETWNTENMEKYLNWELSNIKNCQSDSKIKSRIFDILNLGTELARKNKDKSKQFNLSDKRLGYGKILKSQGIEDYNFFGKEMFECAEGFVYPEEDVKKFVLELKNLSFYFFRDELAYESFIIRMMILSGDNLKVPNMKESKL